MNDSSSPQSSIPTAGRLWPRLRRFVVLEHDHPVLHWDLLIESGDVLRSWRLSDRPAAGRRIVATPVPDHRLIYLDYEGPVSGDRGSVIRVCSGTLEETSAADCYRVCDSAIANSCRLERDGDLCWWVFE